MFLYVDDAEAILPGVVDAPRIYTSREVQILADNRCTYTRWIYATRLKVLRYGINYDNTRYALPTRLGGELAIRPVPVTS